MVLWHLKSKRSPTGNKLSPYRKKRKFQRGSLFLETGIGKRKVKSAKTRGGKIKFKLQSVEEINVGDRKGGVKRVRIISVTENRANPHFVRMNIITKGSVVQTEIGKVLVTSRPGQQGSLSGKLIEGKK